MKHLFSILLISISFTILLENTKSFASTEVSGNISEDTIWTLNGSPYILSGSIYIENEATLTIESGVNIDLYDNNIYVGWNSAGTLIANNATFNSSYEINTRDIYLNNGGNATITNSTMDHVSVNVNDGAGNAITITGNSFSNVFLPINISANRSPTISHNTFGNNVKNEKIGIFGDVRTDNIVQKYDLDFYLSGSIYIENEATLTIESGVNIDLYDNNIYVGWNSAGTLIANNATFNSSYEINTRDIYLNNGGNATITNSTMDHVSVNVNDGAGNEITIKYCDIINVSIGINNKSSFIINAENNWWGDATGPTHISNPDGKGVELSDNVDFRPWSIEPNTIDITKPTLEKITVEDHFSVPTKTLQMLYDIMLTTYTDIFAHGDYIFSTVNLKFSNPESISQIKGTIIPAYIFNSPLIYENSFIKKDESTYTATIRIQTLSDVKTPEETFFNIASETFSNNYHIGGIPAYKQNPVFPTMRLEKVNVTLINGEKLFFLISLEEGELPSFSDRLWNMTYFHDNKITIAGFSPIDILVIDSEGKKVGTEYINGESKTYFEIPNSIYSGDTEPEYVILGDAIDLDYKIIVQGIDTGTFNQTIKKYESKETQVSITEITYKDVPTDKNTKATLNLSITSEDYRIEIDENNDKIIDKIKEPDSIKTETVTSVEESAEALPTTINLYQNYPNPFNPITTIQYEIPVDCHVELVIYDILGRKIAVLEDNMKSAGTHEAVWNGKNENGTIVGSGVYLYWLKAYQYIGYGKMLLIR